MGGGAHGQQGMTPGGTADGWVQAQAAGQHWSEGGGAHRWQGWSTRASAARSCEGKGRVQAGCKPRQHKQVDSGTLGRDVGARRCGAGAAEWRPAPAAARPTCCCVRAAASAGAPRSATEAYFEDEGDDTLTNRFSSTLKGLR